MFFYGLAVALSMGFVSCSENDSEPTPDPTPNPGGGGDEPTIKIVTLPESVVDGSVVESISGLCSFDYNEDGTIKDAKYVSGASEYDVTFTYDSSRAWEVVQNYPTAIKCTNGTFTYETSEMEYSTRGFVTSFKERYHSANNGWEAEISYAITYDEDGRIQIMFKKIHGINYTEEGENTYTYRYDNGNLISVESYSVDLNHPEWAGSREIWSATYEGGLENKYNVFNPYFLDNFNPTGAVMLISGFMGVSTKELATYVDVSSMGPGTIAYDFDADRHITSMVFTWEEGKSTSFDFGYDTIEL